MKYKFAPSSLTEVIGYIISISQICQINVTAPKQLPHLRASSPGGKGKSDNAQKLGPLFINPGNHRDSTIKSGIGQRL